MNKKGIILAILAAALYAINSPLSKLLLQYVPEKLMAGLLYLGAILSLVIFGEIPGPHFFVALIFMAIGAWLSA